MSQHTSPVSESTELSDAMNITNGTRSMVQVVRAITNNDPEAIANAAELEQFIKDFQ